MDRRHNNRLLIGKHGLPDHLADAMRDEGIDPDAITIESAEGWRYDSGIDLSSDDAFNESLDLLRTGAKWREQLAGAHQGEEVHGEPGKPLAFYLGTSRKSST
jgi:hypothetical protein